MSVPATVTLSLSSANKAHDINPRPTATPRDWSEVELCACVVEVAATTLEQEFELAIWTGAGAEFDSKGSRT
jgi:hypothetical protein